MASRTKYMWHTYVWRLDFHYFWNVRLNSFSATLYILAKKLARVLSLPLSLNKALASKLQQTKRQDPEWHKHDSAIPEVALIASVMVVLKMVYGLDGRLR